MALGAMAAILLVAVPLMFLLNGEGDRPSRRAQYPVEGPSIDEKPQPPGRLRPPDEQPVNSNPVNSKPINSSGDAGPKDVTIEQVEKIAAQFMRRISSDDRPYVFPSYAVDALGDITKRVEQYSRSLATASALNSIATAGPEIAAASRREGIEPGLVIYTALAETDGGQRVGDQSAVARRILPDLLSLRKTLGTESADKSLILVAAYKMGGWTKKSHPLLATMRRVVKNPLTDRNVWYLREQNGLDQQAYDFVVSFIALGVIAENPRRFGVAAPPTSF
jgi:hypothetical protein